MKKKQKQKTTLAFILTLRILVPFVLFFNPYIALGMSLFLDQVDGQYFFDLGVKWHIYNAIDKVLDYWWYLGILGFISVSYPQYFFIFLALLIVRTIGQIAGVFLKKEYFYILFPNIYEWFFILTLFLPFLPLNWEIRLFVASGIAVLLELAIHATNIHIVSKYILKKEIKWEKNKR